jgi:predicted O-methyltransferase YrrM
LISIEGCPETYSIAKENLKPYPIALINNTFKNVIQSFSEEKFDLVFIDGHHDGKALIEYLDALSPFTHKNTVFILDDIRWSNSMLDSWNKLKGSDSYHLSMDFFNMGILVKRPQQVKENFILRFKK